jgi:hypothetical protein
LERHCYMISLTIDVGVSCEAKKQMIRNIFDR